MSIPGSAVRRHRTSGDADAERPLRVLVAHPGAELYGADRMLLETVVALTDAGAEVTVAVPSPGPLTGRLVALGVRVVECRMPVLRRSALRPRGAARLLLDALRGAWPSVRLIRRSDRVYVNTLTLPSWIVLARLLRRPVTCHVHEAEGMTARLPRFLLTLPVTLADQIIVNSVVTRTVLAESAPRAAGRAVVVHNGVPGPIAVVPPRAQLSGTVRLLFVGRLSPRKGADVAVAAVSALRNEGVDVRLDILGSVFAGYEWFEDRLRSVVAQAALEDRVTFLGFRSDVWPLIAAADLVLVPSVGDESFGNTAVEAILAGRPLVVSAIPGLQEAVEGFRSVQIVRPGDAAALAEAVKRATQDWPMFSTRAVEDADRASRRLAPTRYRSEIARVVMGPSAAVGFNDNAVGLSA